MNTQDIVAKLWNQCHILRDDGTSYQDYVNELSFLLFLKMMKETGQESELPEGYRWGDLEEQGGVDQLAFYRGLLLHLGTEGSERVRAIFRDANTSLKQPRNLAKLVQNIDDLDWYSAREEGLGDMYEGLLEKNASEKKSGAGQYFTPRPLIECMVNCIKPQPGELIQDPAAGTGGFLIASHQYICNQTDDLFDLDTAEQEFQKRRAYHAIELVPDAHRLLMMNCILHGVDGTLLNDDAMGSAGQNLPKADVILTNPPFGTKRGGGRPTRDDFTLVTGNKQLAFLQHIYRGLKPGGRAAVVLPDNVLFEEGVGTKIRADLMDKCNLHTILRLPTGIFYAQGVKTNVLFFTRGKSDTGNTKNVWVYDLRTNMPAFGKRTPLAHEHFVEFEKAFGKKSDGTSKRQDQGEEGRFSACRGNSMCRD
jgi:type I restriction enzyme M protein